MDIIAPPYKNWRYYERGRRSYNTDGHDFALLVLNKDAYDDISPKRKGIKSIVSPCPLFICKINIISQCSPFAFQRLIRNLTAQKRSPLDGDNTNIGAGPPTHWSMSAWRWHTTNWGPGRCLAPRYQEPIWPTHLWRTLVLETLVGLSIITFPIVYTLHLCFRWPIRCKDRKIICM